MKPVVFIHTNDYQLLGAKLSAHSLKSASRHPDEFEVRILRLEETPHLNGRVGQRYLRTKGRWVEWISDNPQSFTPLRFLPPQAMGFQGRALVIDPDVFAIGDVYELLSRDMEGKALMCRRTVSGKETVFASSVMLMDCEKLKHWRWDEQIDEMFAGERAYRPWIDLQLEPEENIGLFEDSWNHFDTLDASTRMIHFTRRVTQPWKTGLRLLTADGSKAVPGSLLDRLLGRRPKHERNPDPNQEAFFFGLFQRCLDAGVVTRQEVEAEIRKGNLRPDMLQVLESRRAAA